MTFADAVTAVFSDYATFPGRAPRQEYWYFILFQCVASMVLALLNHVLTGSASLSIWVLGIAAIYWIATALPTIAVTVRRLHDIGRGGGWICLMLIPVVGVIWLLILLMLPSGRVENRFGRRH